MKKQLTITTFVSAAALSLAACDSQDVENTPVDDIDEIVDEDVPEEGYPAGGELNEAQQANFDAMDWQAVSDEYDSNLADMQAERTSSSEMQGSSPSSGNSMTADSTSNDSASTMSDSTSDMSDSPMPSRSDMNFSYLDRNEDGQLSVAEYAIWALPTNPNPPEQNDARGPHLTQDEINTAGQTFFYFDDDGDTYLSQEEFQDARNSTRVA